MIYLNNAATTVQKPPAVAEAVVAAMAGAGSCSRGAADDDLAAARSVASARSGIARLIGFAHPERVAFTLNATMALNTAIFGLLRRGDHVITTDFEHNSVLRPLHELERRGVIELDYLPADASGRLRMEELDGLFRPNTRAVVATHASNLTGAVTDARALAHAAPCSCWTPRRRWGRGRSTWAPSARTSSASRATRASWARRAPAGSRWRRESTWRRSCTAGRA